MKNHINGVKNSLKNFKENSVEKTKKLSQAVVASAVLCLTGCADDGKNKEITQKTTAELCEMRLDKASGDKYVNDLIRAHVYDNMNDEEYNRKKDKFYNSCENLPSEEKKQMLIQLIPELNDVFMEYVQQEEKGYPTKAIKFQNIFISMDKNQQVEVLNVMYESVFGENVEKYDKNFRQKYLKFMVQTISFDHSYQFPNEILEYVDLEFLMSYFLEGNNSEKNRRLNNEVFQYLWKNNRKYEILKHHYRFAKIPEKYITKELLNEFLYNDERWPAYLDDFHSIVEMFMNSENGKKLIKNPDFIYQSLKEVNYEYYENEFDERLDILIRYKVVSRNEFEKIAKKYRFDRERKEKFEESFF